VFVGREKDLHGRSGRVRPGKRATEAARREIIGTRWAERRREAGAWP
jgi:hypothetical protein